MHSILDSLAGNPELIVGLVCGSLGILTVGFIAALIASTKIRATREREISRREIAAYVAEGALSPADAELLLQPRPWWSKSAQSAAERVRDAAQRCQANRA